MLSTVIIAKVKEREHHNRGKVMDAGIIHKCGEAEEGPSPMLGDVEDNVED